MSKLKIINQEELKDWAKEVFQKNSFNMVDVSSKKETFRRALASGKIYVGKEVFDLIKNKKMPKGDPITLAEVSAVLGVKKTSELIPLCHPLPIDHTATKIIMNELDSSLEVFCVVSAVAKTGVEMEAIMGVNSALITIYDLSKIVNPHLKIDNVKLLSIKDLRNQMIEFIDMKFKGNETFKKIIKSSAFCSSDDKIVSDNYKIVKKQNFSIIPPIGGG